MNKVGQNILKIRKEKKLSQKELAKLVGINVQNLLRIEKGDADPKSGTLEKIMEALEITPNELWGEADFYPFHIQLPFSRNLSREQDGLMLSDDEFAALLHISVEELINLKNGKTLPSPHTLTDICTRLKISENALTDSDTFSRSTKEVDLLNNIEYKNHILEQIHIIEKEGAIQEGYSEDGKPITISSDNRIKRMLLYEFSTLSLEKMLLMFEGGMDKIIVSLSDALYDKGRLI